MTVATSSFSRIVKATTETRLDTLPIFAAT